MAAFDPANLGTTGISRPAFSISRVGRHGSIEGNHQLDNRARVKFFVGLRFCVRPNARQKGLEFHKSVDECIHLIVVRRGLYHPPVSAPPHGPGCNVDGNRAIDFVLNNFDVKILLING